MKIIILRIIAVFLLILLVAGVLFLYLYPEKRISANEPVALQDEQVIKDELPDSEIINETSDVVEEAETEESTDADKNEADELTDEDDEDETSVEDRLLIQQELNTHLKEEQASMNLIITSKEAEDEIVSSRILKAYEENVLLAIEIKALAMQSLGYEVPSGFPTGEEDINDFGDYLKESVLDGVVSGVADGAAKDILKNGISGGVEGFKSGGNLSEALTGALSSASEGVASALEDSAVSMVEDTLDGVTGGLFGAVKGLSESDSVEDWAENSLDQKTGGIIGSVKGVINYDKTPGALLQGIADDANNSAGRIKELLNKEKMTSSDVSSLLYEYARFGNTMDNLRENGASVSYEWEDNYKKMDILYKRFLRNEMMLRLLKDEVKDK